MTNAERNPFSPLYVRHAAFIFPFQPASGQGKKYGRASENFKVTQTFCGSEIPPCFPTARRSRSSVKIFGIAHQTMAIVPTLISKRPSDLSATSLGFSHQHLELSTFRHSLQ